MAQTVVQINFKLHMSGKEYEQAIAPLAQPLADVAGLRWKIWLLIDIGATTMTAILVQTAITVLWGTLIILHTRRLFRLAHVDRETSRRNQHVHRLWWWLGREEFWRKVQIDTWRCLELTLMIVLLAWTI
jgi:Putative mono-oxygenase ydhR